MKMKNASIRTRILAGVVIVNLLGAVAVSVYLHETFSAGLGDDTSKMVSQSLAAWEQLGGTSTGLDIARSPEKVARLLEKMKAITEADYGFLLDKEITSAEAYAKTRERQNLPDNWDEGETYALAAVTDEGVGEKMRFEAAPEDVPEEGKLVGVENGACSKTCHGAVAGKGDYWAIRWSDDAKTRGHAVFAVSNAEGKPLGVVYGIGDLSKHADADRASMMQTLLVVGVTLLVATVVIGGLVDALVLKRLAKMTVSMQDIGLRVAGGDFDARFQPDGTADEIGSFETFFAQLIELMSSTLKRLSKTE